MVDLWLGRLNNLLAELELTEDAFIHLTTSQMQLRDLLKQQRRLEAGSRQIAGIEENLGAKVGWPRIVLELDDQRLEFITRAEQIELLVQGRQISIEQGDWLRSELYYQLGRCRRAARSSGLPRLRRLQLLLGRLVDASMHKLTSRSGHTLGDMAVRLALMSVSREPGPAADLLLRAARNLVHIAHQGTNDPS